jgi:hypothetical protein
MRHRAGPVVFIAPDRLFGGAVDVGQPGTVEAGIPRRPVI